MSGAPGGSGDPSSLLVDLDADGNLVFEAEDDSSVLALLSDAENYARRARGERRGAMGGERVAATSEKSLAALTKKLTSAKSADSASRMQLRAAQAVQYWSEVARPARTERKLREIDLGSLRASLASGTLGSDVLEIAQTVVDRFNEAQRIFLQACCKSESFGFLTQSTMASYFQNIRVVDSVVETLDASISAVSPLLQILASEVARLQEVEQRLTVALKKEIAETSDAREEQLRLRRKYDELLHQSAAKDARKLKKFKDGVQKALDKFPDTSTSSSSMEEIRKILGDLPDMQNRLLFLPSIKKFNDHLSTDFRLAHLEICPPAPKLRLAVATMTAEEASASRVPKLAIDRLSDFAMPTKVLKTQLVQTADARPPLGARPEIREISDSPPLASSAPAKSPASLVSRNFRVAEISALPQPAEEPRRNFQLAAVQDHTSATVQSASAAFLEFAAALAPKISDLPAVAAVVTLNATAQTVSRKFAEISVQTEQKIFHNSGTEATPETFKSAVTVQTAAVEISDSHCQTEEIPVAPAPAPALVSAAVSPLSSSIGNFGALEISGCSVHVELENVAAPAPVDLEISSALGSVEISSRSATRELRRGGGVVIERPASRPMSVEGERIFEFTARPVSVFRRLELVAGEGALVLAAAAGKRRRLEISRSARISLLAPAAPAAAAAAAAKSRRTSEFVVEGERLSSLERIAADFGLDRGDLSPKSRKLAASAVEKVLAISGEQARLNAKTQRVTEWLRIGRPHISYLDVAELLVRVEQARDAKELDAELLGVCDSLKTRLPGKVRELMADKLRMGNHPNYDHPQGNRGTQAAHAQETSENFRLAGDATIMQLVRQVENFQVRRDLYAAVQLLLQKETTKQCSVCLFCRRKTQQPPATSSTVPPPDHHRSTVTLFQWTASSMLTRPDSMWTNSRPDTDGYGGLRRPPTTYTNN